MEYRVRVVRNEAGLEQLEESWTRLLGESRSGTIFASYPWNLAWWHAFGKGKRLYVIVVEDDEGRVRGIAPLMTRLAGPIRKLELIGTGLSDMGDFLLDKSCAEQAAGAIFAYLRKQRRKWDMLDMDEVPPYSLLAGQLHKEKPDGLHVIRLLRTDCPYIALPPTWEEYTHTLQRKVRQHLDAFAPRVVAEMGASFRLVSEEADVPAAVERFYKLHLERWETKEGDLNPEHRSEAFLPFLEEACRRTAAAGLLRISELCVDEDVIATCVGFHVNGRWSGYMTGFDPEWSNKRPGKVLHRFMVRRAMSEHTREFDFGRGSEGYKYELGAISRKNRRFVITSTAPSSRLALGLMRLRLRAREYVRRYRARQQEVEGSKQQVPGT